MTVSKAVHAFRQSHSPRRSWNTADAIAAFQRECQKAGHVLAVSEMLPLARQKRVPWSETIVRLFGSHNGLVKAAGLTPRVALNPAQRHTLRWHDTRTDYQRGVIRGDSGKAATGEALHAFRLWSWDTKRMASGSLDYLETIYAACIEYDVWVAQNSRAAKNRKGFTVGKEFTGMAVGARAA